MSAQSFAAKWHEQLFRTDAVDRPRAEEAIGAFYGAAGMAPPERFLWFASPLEAIWSLAVLLGDDEPYTQPLLEDVRRRSGGKARLEEIADALADRLGVGADAVPGCLGVPLSTLSGSRAVSLELARGRIDTLVARAGAGPGWQEREPGPFALVDAAEEQLFGYRRPGLFAAAADRSGAKAIADLLNRSAQHRLYVDRAFGEIARDQAIADRESIAVTPLLRAFWAACEATGLWWPMEKGVVLSERPTIVEGAGENLRMQWADGFVVGARPTKPAVAAAPAAAGAAGRASGAPILEVELPRRHEERLSFLRERAPGLPFLDRYLAGEHEQVWKDLVALGEEVRSERHAADALAVAYETMQRVERNVRTLAGRLERLGYRFVEPGASGGVWRSLLGGRRSAEHPPHVPPSADTAGRIAELERIAGGPIPLSLRAFFDVVGEVNFIGEHESLVPADHSLLPDPLFVHGVEDAIGSVESWDEDEAIFAFAPDACHKANLSGGDPYIIRLPAPAADAPVAEAPHDMHFVEYLRFAIVWGGFPGWEAARGGHPAALDELRREIDTF